MSDISLLLEETEGALEEATSPSDLSLTQSNQSDINNAERLTSEDNQSSSHMGGVKERLKSFPFILHLSWSELKQEVNCWHIQQHAFLLPGNY